MHACMGIDLVKSWLWFRLLRYFVEHSFQRGYDYLLAVQFYVAFVLQFVECLRYVQACLAQYAGKAFHLYLQALAAGKAVAAHADELYNASFDACGGVVPYGVALHLGAAAYEVE